MKTNHALRTNSSKHVKRISVSLPPKLLSEFDKEMRKAGYSDRSKAIQTAIHFFIDESSLKMDENKNGAGAIILLYDNHTYNQDASSTHEQHRFNDIISAATHVHLDDDTCLETILVRGEMKRIKDLAKHMSENRGIKSLKVNFVTLV